ncbi:hypothetical protein DOTSEDRAFT_70526 [Dothistroma septosporum NZE10]|uniref:TPR domain-containing protein n=1 Tax=Dothistroma septosporum (strain NZE10 / CBS 128990) TaxID=675120 RepID=N1PT37_DOTSN|nr:hypothetical protein DOTSEDRAFT_70526 [Dothistroma septosporum NZE10]
MSVRPVLSLPLREALRQIPRSSRQLHHAPKRPIDRRLTCPCRHGGIQQQRFRGSFTDGANKLWKENPFSMVMAAIAILMGVGGVFYANYLYQTYIIASFHKYPEAVAKKLRRAIYYTNVDLQPQEAIKYYRQALQEADEVGMDPFSDEIIGVKIQVAKLMEDIQQWHKAIEVLERVRADNLAWLEQRGLLEGNKKKRTNVLAKTVGLSVKLGELYGTPAVYDREVAQERLVWAVETVLKERQRRQSKQVKEEEEGPWMNDEEVGAALESLAHSYEAKDQHYLATPLFLQALSLYPHKDCHQVILMNNLASSLAQQSPQAARAAQTYATSRNINDPPSGLAASKESMIENAKTWAQKALDVAAAIKPPVRNEECDVGCAVAMHNLGEFAEMSKDVNLARSKYKEAIGLARAIGFQEGVEQSSARLRDLVKIA